ncbi:MAG: class I SAM-dependent methyltransferase [Deltaproteobacteria bacterium]|nr:class I SAM-dependent methyltransferase [Deltaproteobacteria bacterium]
MDPKAYYDEFSTSYEKERAHGYHALVDELETKIALEHVRGMRVLEAGCGTGIILERLEKDARVALGVDLSRGMLGGARRRGLAVAQANLGAIPFASDSFDVVCSFKVLAHVPDIRGAIAELARVTRPGGTLLLEFYNPRSIRWLAKKLAGPRKISARTDESAVFTRYDDAAAIASYLPAGVRAVALRGIRVVTPGAFVHRIPIVSEVFTHVERMAAASPLSRLGGFLVAILRKDPVTRSAGVR